MKDKITTLLLIIKDSKILLAQKKRGFGVGMFNGVGGKVEIGETIEQGMLRETREEINVKPIDYTKRAILTFNLIENGERIKMVMHVYVCNDYIGEITESEEMRPQWFEIDNIPFDRMFSDDQIWLPILLKGENFVGYFKFDKDFNVIEHNIEIK